MTSKIKVDNIENQCGGAVVTKCGGTTTISGSVVKANDVQAADGGNLVSQCGTTITLGASGDTINLASGASQSGFGRTGTVDWDTTPKTATFSAVSGNGYFCNTSGGAFTVNLPAGSAGAIVSLADYAATWQTNALTVSPNGSEKIGAINADVTLSTEGQSVTLVYVDGTQGWINTMDSTSNVRGNPNLVATGGTITTCGNFKIHTFTGPGTFTVTNASATAAENTVGYMVLAGGGGGSGRAGGGGGAGGFREGRNVPIDNFTASPLVANAPTNAVTVSVQAYPITVGGAGAPGPSGESLGGNGNPSIFATITSTGGGGGSYIAGNPGGSGGGGGRTSPHAAGNGNTPPVSPSQGNDGGTGEAPAKLAGGGGASASGLPASSQPGGGPGGNGVATSITGSSVTRAGGGGGSRPDTPPDVTPAGSGGSGGGGAGAPGSPSDGISGTVNTGGGGGGGYGVSPGIGGAGGSGIVIIRYKFQ